MRLEVSAGDPPDFSTGSTVGDLKYEDFPGGNFPGILSVASEAHDRERFGFSFIWQRSSLRNARKKYVLTFFPS